MDDGHFTLASIRLWRRSGFCWIHGLDEASGWLCRQFLSPRAESLIELLGSERVGLRSGCLLKAPLLMGNDVRNMSASTLGIYGAEEVIQVDQTWGKQVGFFRCLNSLAKHSAERETLLAQRSEIASRVELSF